MGFDQRYTLGLIAWIAGQVVQRQDRDRNLIGRLDQHSLA